MSHEVGIIGAGAHGASAAFHLARRGARTIVFERGAHAAAGPTGQASGVVRSYYTNETLARIARESTAFLAAFPEHVGAHAESGYVRTGGLYLHDDGDEADVRATSAGLLRAGVEHALLDRDALRADFPGLSLDGVAVGVWEPGAGYADPAATTLGLAARATELGATILTGTTVAAVREHAGGVSVRLADGTTHAVDRLLVAAGPWTGPLLEQVGVALPLTAERHVVAGLRHGADTADSAIGHVLIDVGRGYYSRPAAGDEFLLGPLAPTAPTDPGDFDPRISPDEFRSLATVAAARAPIRASATRSRGWAALYDVSPDWQPVIGQVGERIFVDAGTSGHGFKLAPVLGDLVARLLLGDPDPALAPFHPDRFAAPAGLASGFGTARILG